MIEHPLRVLITGSNRGIGRETARYFAVRGARLAINGRDSGRLEEVRRRFQSAGGDIAVVPGDISDPSQARDIVERAVGNLGGLDVLVNNAALSMRGRFDELDPSVIADVIGVNVTGTLLITRAAIPHLKESRGSVVFISSVAGLWGFPLISVYAASKMALTAAAESLRTELSGDGVHVGILHVGITQHDRDKAILAADGSPLPLEPRPRAATQEQVARVVYRMIRRRRFRVVLTPAGRLLSGTSRFFPGLLAALVAAAGRRVRRIAR